MVAAAPAPATPPGVRELLVSLHRTLKVSRCPDDELVLFSAWAAWVLAVTAAPRARSDARPCASYSAARELVIEVSSRVVRAHAGCAVELREGLLSQIAAGERLVVALLDRHMLQRGRR